jgi:hypothetical protein
LTASDTSLLLRVMPVVVEGAVGAVDDVGITDKAAVSGKVMKSGMMSIKSEMADLPLTDLVSLNSSMASSGIKGLAEAGFAVSEIAQAVQSIASGAVAAMDDADIPAEALSSVAGAITMGAMSSLDELPLTAAQLVDLNVASAVVSGAVESLADAGLSADVAVVALKEIMTEAVLALDSAGFADATQMTAVLEEVTSAAVNNLDATLFSGSDVVDAMGAISSGIGAGCVELADAGGIAAAELTTMLQSASATIAEEAVGVAADFGVDESELAQTIAQDLLEGVSQGGGDVADVTATVTAAITAQDWATDVSAAVDEGAAAAEVFDQAVDNQDAMTACSDYEAKSDAEIETAAASLPVFCRYSLGQSCPTNRTIFGGTTFAIWDGNFADPICSLYIVGVPGVEPTATAVASTSPESTSTPVTIPAPASISITAWGSGVDVAWDAVLVGGVAATDYRLYYSSSSASPETATFLDVTPADSTAPTLHLTSAQIPTLSSVSFLCFRVHAYYGSELGNLSDVVCRASSTVQPTAVATSGSVPSSIDVTWSALSGATSYRLYYSASGTGDVSTWGSVSPVTSPWSLTSLTPGGTYYLRLAAVYNAAGSELEVVQSSSTVASASAGLPAVSYVGATGNTAVYGASTSIAPTSLVSNGSAITSCSVSPTLPTGLSINQTTCVISGTPTAYLATTSYTVTPSNAVGSGTSAMVSISVGCDPSLFGGGTGTIATPYLIATRTHLENIGSCPWTGAHYFQTAAIDMGGVGTPWTAMPVLFGAYSGNGWAINNLYISDTSIVTGHLTGLFSQVAPTGTLINTFVFGAQVAGAMTVGILAGENLGTIDGCGVSGALSLASTATVAHYGGGLVGRVGSTGQLKNSYSQASATIKGTGTGVANLGGLVGQALTGAILLNSYATGTVTTASPYTSAVGGTFYMGGLVGAATGATVDSCYSSGDVLLSSSGLNGSGGIGLIGNLTGGTVFRSYSAGNYGIQGYLRYLYAGGIAGYVSGGPVIISNSYSKAAMVVTTGPANGGNVGGLLGNVSGTVTLSNTYAASAAFPATMAAGSKFGFSGVTLTSGLTGAYFYLTGNVPADSSTGVVGLTTLGQMTVASSFTPFDFTNVWRMPTSAPGGLLSPVLLWQCNRSDTAIACP